VKEEREAQLQAIQLKALQDAQSRQQYSQALLQAGANQGMEQFQSPEMQSALRMREAAYGTPGTAEAGGLLQAPTPKINPATLLGKSTPASVEQYMRTGSISDLVPVEKDPPQRKTVTQNGVVYYADTGEKVLPAVGGPPVDTFDQESKLRAEALKQTEGFRQIENSFGSIQAAAKDPSAAGDLALIFNYMKMLDPGSTVREGEFANAQNAGGVDAKVQSFYNNVLRGERLTEAQRKDFLGQSASQYNSWATQYDRTRDYYRGLSSSYEINPDRVGLNARAYNQAMIDAMLGKAPMPVVAPNPVFSEADAAAQRILGASQ
jgi:hypothetical protein